MRWRSRARVRIGQTALTGPGGPSFLLSSWRLVLHFNFKYRCHGINGSTRDGQYSKNTTRQSSQVQESDSHGGYGAWEPSEIVWVSLLYRLQTDANATNIPHSSIACTCAHSTSIATSLSLTTFSDISLSNNPDLHLGWNWNTHDPVRLFSVRILSGQVLKIRVPEVGHLLPRPEGRKYGYRNGRGEAFKSCFVALIEHKFRFVLCRVFMVCAYSTVGRDCRL